MALDTPPSPPSHLAFYQSIKTHADLLIAYLQQLNIDYVFGVPGGAIEPFYNALGKAENLNVLKAVTARHETGAAFMAEGYFRKTGKLGVCCSTTGPGATNLITGVASASVNKIPMLVITPQTPLPGFGREACQESSCTSTDILSMFEPCTRYNSLVSHPQQLETKIVAALMAAFGDNPGPVHLSVPMDIFNAPCDSPPKYFLPDLLNRRKAPLSSQLNLLSEKLNRSKRSVFLLDEGAIPYIDEILQTLALCNAECVVTPNAKGCISSYHPKFRGVFGFAGHEQASLTINSNDTDLIICVGYWRTEWQLNSWDNYQLENKDIIHIDTNPSHFALMPNATMILEGDIREIFFSVNARLREQGNKLQKYTLLSKPSFEIDTFNATDKQKIHPAQLLLELPNILPPNTTYYADIGNALAWTIHYLFPKERRVDGLREEHQGLYVTSIHFASMGWAIGNAIGGALGAVNQPVACITGDGCLLMSGQEMTVAKELNLPIYFIILNDNAFGMVKHGQRITGGAQIAYELPSIDFVGFANSMGIEAYKVSTKEDLIKLSQTLRTTPPAPILLDIHIDPEAVPPIGSRAHEISSTDPNVQNKVSTLIANIAE